MLVANSLVDVALTSLNVFVPARKERKKGLRMHNCNYNMKALINIDIDLDALFYSWCNLHKITAFVFIGHLPGAVLN